jgi:hypothetical protein
VPLPLLTTDHQVPDFMPAMQARQAAGMKAGVGISRGADAGICAMRPGSASPVMESAPTMYSQPDSHVAAGRCAGAVPMHGEDASATHEQGGAGSSRLLGTPPCSLPSPGMHGQAMRQPHTLCSEPRQAVSLQGMADTPHRAPQAHSPIAMAAAAAPQQLLSPPHLQRTGAPAHSLHGAHQLPT